MSKDRNKALSHFNSHVIAAIERYSASAEERETICWFLVFHEIGEFPNKIK